MNDKAQDQGLTVLIADASRSNRVMLRKRLERYGYHCLTVETARQALDTLREVQVNALMLDMKFPDLDGWQLVKLVMRQPIGNRPLIIAVTACARPGDEQRLMDCGCDAYIPKPVNFALLIETLDRLVVTGDRRRLIA